MLSASKIWQNVLLKHPSISTIFEKFEEDHEIKKLKL